MKTSIFLVENGANGAKIFWTSLSLDNMILVAIFLIEIIIKNIEFVYDLKYHHIFSNQFFLIFLSNQPFRQIFDCFIQGLAFCLSLLRWRSRIWEFIRCLISPHKDKVCVWWFFLSFTTSFARFYLYSPTSEWTDYNHAA